MATKKDKDQKKEKLNMHYRNELKENVLMIPACTVPAKY